MQLTEVIKTSFIPKRILKSRYYHFAYYVIFFVLLTFVVVFPSSLMIVSEQGWNTNFIKESFLTVNEINALPNDWVIDINGLNVNGNDTQYELALDNITIFFNNDVVDDSTRSIYIKGNEIQYSTGRKALVVKGSFKRLFDERIAFNSINMASGEEKYELFQTLGTLIQNTFNQYVIMFSLLYNFLFQLAANLILVIILGILFRINGMRFQKGHYMTYVQSLKVVIACMFIPSLLAAFLGLFFFSIVPVVFQIGLGALSMFVLLKYSKNEFV